MGFSSGSTKPIYKKEIGDASGALSGAYNANAPKIQGVADQFTGMIPSLLDRFRQGDPALSAASNYITSTLGRDPAQNPMLDRIIQQTGDDTANQTNAHLGTRGLAGGSVMQDMLTRNLSNNASQLRFADWNNGQQRQAQAAGMAPGIAGAQSDLLNPAFNAGQMAMMPMQAAGGYASGVGGLLGQYTKTSQPWGGALMGGIAGGLGAYLGGKR